MATERKSNILYELAMLNDDGINTMTMVASAYRAGIAYGYKQGKDASADQVQSKEVDKA